MVVVVLVSTLRVRFIFDYFQLLLFILLRTSPPCLSSLFFFLMIRRPPRSTLDRSSAASDVYKRQAQGDGAAIHVEPVHGNPQRVGAVQHLHGEGLVQFPPVSYTHLRAHETVLDLVCRLLLEKKT